MKISRQRRMEEENKKNKINKTDNNERFFLFKIKDQQIF